MKKILLKENLPSFVSRLSKDYCVIAPHLEGRNVWNFREVKDPSKVDLTYPNTKVSLKKMVFPQQEVMFNFSKRSDRDPAIIKEEQHDSKDVVVLGSRSCDAHSLENLDKVFSGGDFVDPYYKNKRDNLVVVTLTCNAPESNCFCTSLGGAPNSRKNADVMMTDINGRYFLESLTEKGEALLKQGSDDLKEAASSDESECSTVQEGAFTKVFRKLDEVKSLKETFTNSTFWEKEGEGCISCGICTYLCPTCHCFDINDEVEDESPLVGQRVRNWDNCQFPDFTMHSSGHNPRPNRGSRLRQRVLHKFQYAKQVNNEYFCSGCGRCISNCPVGIDIISVLEKAMQL